TGALFAMTVCPSGEAFTIKTLCGSALTRIVIEALPDVAGERRTRKVVKPAIFKRQAPGAVAVVPSVDAPTRLPCRAYQVVPLSGDASKLSVPTKVPRICTRAVASPPAMA